MSVQNQQKSSKTYKSFGLLVRILGTFLFLYAAFFLFEFQNITGLVGQIDKIYLIGGLGITVLSPLLTTLRLKIFLRVVEINRSYFSCLKASYCGLALNLFLPARGGDLAKMAFLRIGSIPSWSELGTAAILERISDILALTFLGFIAALILGHDVAFFVSFILFFGILTLLFILPKLVYRLKLLEKFKLISEFSNSIRRNFSFMLIGFLTSLSCWITNSIIMGLVLKSINESVTFLHSLVATPPSILAGILPISLWGVGTRDSSLAFFLRDLAPTTEIISAGLLYTVLVYWLLGLLGTPVLFFAKKYKGH